MSHHPVYRFEIAPERPHPAEAWQYDAYTETCLDAMESIREDALFESFTASAL